MTDSEKEELEGRIERADAAKRRLTYLGAAIDKITSQECSHIDIDLQTGKTSRPIRWFRASDERGESVCWSEQELGIVAELRAAVIGVLKARLGQAKTEFEQA